MLALFLVLPVGQRGWWRPHGHGTGTGVPTCGHGAGVRALLLRAIKREGWQGSCYGTGEISVYTPVKSSFLRILNAGGF